MLDDDREFTEAGRAPSVSVVMPVKDREHMVGDAIASVLTQTFDDLELIVVDDGSTDGTGDILRAIERRDQRLRVRSLARSSGACAARNLAAAEARGRYLSFQDSDTLWPKERLARHVHLLDTTAQEVGVVYGFQQSSANSGCRLLPGVGDPVRSGSLDIVLLRHNIVDLPATTMRTIVFREIGGFDERLPRYQDWELFLRLAARTKFLFDDEIAVRGRDNTDRISLDRTAHFEALDILLAKHCDQFRRWPECHVAWRMQCVRRAVGNRDMLGSRQHLAAAIRHPMAVAGWFCERVAHGRHIIDRERALDPNELPRKHP